MLFVLGFIAGAVVLSIYFFHFNGSLSPNQSDWGVFGDYIGGLLNPVFGFLGFTALLITIIFQNKELSLSTEELKRSAHALEKQHAALELQNFENTFFNMLKLHNDIVQDMRDEEREGEEVTVKKINTEDYKIHYDKSKAGESNKFIGRDCLKYCNIAYETFFKDFGPKIGHYFRNLYHIVKLIDESAEKNEFIDPKRYIRIVRAQLSAFELNLLFYNSFSRKGAPFKLLIEKYSLLKNFDPNGCIRPFAHIRLYNDSAYGGREGLEQYYA